MAINVPMELLFTAYTNRYRNIQMEPNALGVMVPVLYEPVSICTTLEMKEIMANANDIQHALTMMHDRIGTIGPARKGR